MAENSSWVREKFQSLMGFPMRCDRTPFPRSTTRMGCFNPLWVFQCAATVMHMLTTPQEVEFQSLMGFPMRCDLVTRAEVSPITWFQSLMGFPMRCDPTQTLSKYNMRALFQSLMGFPMRCDALHKIRVWFPYHSFNPLWVFQCAATLRKWKQMRIEECFNPLWVFQCAAT